MRASKRILAAAIVVAFVGCGESEEAVVVPPVVEQQANAANADRAEAARSRADKTPEPKGRLTVQITRPTRVRATPGGEVVAGLQPRTEFDSPTVVPVVARRDGWLGIVTTALPNGRIGWISANARLVSFRTRWSVVASLGRKEVVVRRGGKVAMRFPVAIGSPSTPTPTGRFAVTDKLLTHNPSSPYGCCILALSAHQPHTPQGWGGGDRVAIHATNLPESIGTAASLGCLRGPAEAVSRAVRQVPLGTLVTIRG